MRTELLIGTLREWRVSEPEAIADAILAAMLAAPEKIRIKHLRYLMDGKQCLICGDMLD